MALISLQDISLAFNGPPLLDGINLQMEQGERIALLGRNGTGKTTLMKVIARQLKADKGIVDHQKGIRVAHLPQEVPTNITGKVFDVVLSGLGEKSKLLNDYHHVSRLLETDHSAQLMGRLAKLQGELDHTNGWEVHRRIEEVVRRMKLEPDGDFEDLSGGQKRRTLLAKALVLEPEVLLLDEPTNHLDIESIDWLEGFLKGYSGTLFFVTHDRMFLSRLATRIMELDRGRLFSWPCDYRTFMERKTMALEAEETERARFDKKLAQEEVWIRQGVKARRTRNEGRVRALEELRKKKKAQRLLMEKVRMKVQEADRSGELVTKAENLSHGYGEKCLIKNFSTQIMRGDKIGVMGPNGSGKTTLLRILLGELRPQEGTVTLGTNLEISYYDQLRQQLDENKTVKENICDELDTVTINGASRNIMGYLQEFLFSSERARTPVKLLSGGERNRLLLARLFTRPSNLLVMDEPTNDLDVETLELLEDLLVRYSGTLLLVSHDRAFLNNVVTSTLVLEGEGQVHEYPGGYDDWLVQRPVKSLPTQETKKAVKQTPETGKQSAPRKLSFKELRELEKIPGKIEELEAEHQNVITLMADPLYYQKDPKELAKDKSRLASIDEELAGAYERWEALEGLKHERGT